MQTVVLNIVKYLNFQKKDAFSFCVEWYLQFLGHRN